ncbi:DUF424 family protein [Candidatus Woesearchaeota archaeon]|nr:DUF424 family protein [Candidatus Woesearchaeota archaeon]
MIVKKHISGGKTVLAVCDSEILGKKFEEKGLQLDLSAGFYKGEEMSEENLRNQLADTYALNIVGVKSIDFFLKEGLANKEHLLVIEGIPHIQIILGN